ncbi:MAG: hypothetical protein A4E63_01633 [Syntrophorhabdus sp. PtaU1.Bin050]|nr:MAG: hypothetical protein A4E63_01633 [Syntrophorhabdus sp. PtaU1.Bin050]
MSGNMKVKLGTATNLLYGYDASWLSESQGNNALFPVPEKSLEEIDVISPAQTGTWSFPHISLHDTAVSLLDALLPYRIENPSDGTKAPVLPAGPLLICDCNRDQAIVQLSETLGIKLGGKGYGYALVQLKRIDGENVHPSSEMGVLIHPNPSRIPEELGVGPEFKKSVASLKRVKVRGSAFTPDVVSEQDANDYLNLFARHGTHFVSKITFGDVIFQVFAMPEQRYNRVKKLYAGQPDMLSGPKAVLFRQYTTDFNTGAYGYVKEYGKILSFSQSPVLRQSVKDGEWFEQIFARTDSIFAVFQNDARITTDTLNTKYTDMTAVMTDLTSMTLFLEHSRKQIWERVFKGGLIQKYRAAIQPHFVAYWDNDLDTILPHTELPGFLSNIATPVINTYKTGLDLSDVDFVAPDEVMSFTLCSNYLHNSQNKTIRIPGDDVFVCGQLVALETEEYTTTVQVNDKALDTLAFSSQHFYGVLLVQNASNTGHFTLVDGLKYVSNRNAPDGRYYVQVTEDVRKVPRPDKIGRLKSSLQFSYSFSEAIIGTLSTGSSPAAKSFLQESLLWITQIIPANTKDADLLGLRLQALDLAHIESDTALGAFVPILPYEEYQRQIDSILDYIKEIDDTIDRYHSDIEARKTQELLIDVAKDLNKNIVDSGKLLAGYVNAGISQQEHLSGYYASIIKQKQAEQKQIENNMGDLQAQLNSQQAKVQTAVENYKQAIEDWKITEEIKFGLTVATDLFSLGTSIFVPASSLNAVKDLGLMVQRIQKFLNIINATYKVFTDTKTGIEKIQDAQKTLDGLSGTLSPDLSWDELSINLDVVLSSGPSDSQVNSAKAALVAAFKIYVLKGKALASAKSSLQQIARETYNQQRQKDLIDEQSKELSDLETNLNPARISELDKSKIDLTGLTGKLSMVRSQMLSVLSRAFTCQDQALQYTYLQPPTVIPSFDILGIKSALVTQKSNTIAAKTSLSQCQATITTPIDVEIEVPVEDLRNGGVYQFNLQPNAPEFFQYVDVKVQSVIARIDGLKSTESGNYLLELAYNGRPFFDRAVDRDTSVFNTLRRERTYEYIVEGNQPKFIDKGETWSDGVNPITPFSIWEISLPDTRTNRGLTFKGLTAKVTLTFILNTRIHDVRQCLLMSTGLATAEAIPSKPPVSTLLSQMAGKSVLNNWDVVFNMSLDKINDVLKSQYDELKQNDKQYGGKVSADTSIQGANIGDILTYTLQKFNINYGYPELQFLVNNDNTGNLQMQITSGTVQKGTRYVGDTTDVDKTLLVALAKAAGLSESDIKEETIGGKRKLVLQYYNDPTPLGTSATLQAVVKLAQTKGLVNDNNNILSVVLNMSQGAFSANNIEIEMSDEQKIAFSEAVKAYFVTHPITFVINSLDLTNIATLADLKPHQFLFKALQTQTNNQMLQLFIQTNMRDAFNYSQAYINSGVSDPITEGSDCSLMISSRIFFGSVLPASVNTGWTLVGSKGGKPEDPAAAWSGQFTAASLQGNVDLSSLSRSYTPPTRSAVVTTTYYTYEPTGGNPVSWSLNGMTITPGGNGQMVMNYSEKKIFNFTENSDTAMSSIFGTTHTKRSSQLSTDITLSITSSLPTKIGVVGKEQNIQISMASKDVSIAARTSGGGPCGSKDLQAQINEQLQSHLPGQLTTKLNVSFNGISVFALNNLLFPSNNRIILQDVYVPGDLLILGNFEKPQKETRLKSVGKKELAGATRADKRVKRG